MTDLARTIDDAFEDRESVGPSTQGAVRAAVALNQLAGIVRAGAGSALAEGHGVLTRPSDTLT